MPKKIIFIISAVILTILLSYLVLRQNSQSPEDIVISVANQPAMGLIFIAAEKGFFEENGLNVIYRRHVLGRDALNDVLSGKADLATVFDSVVAKNIYEGKDLGILTSLHKSNRYHALASYKSAGIASPEYLFGKKIGVTLGISSEFFLYTLLMSNGLTREQVTLINIAPDKMIEALNSNTIDAAVLFSPYLQMFEAKNRNKNINLLYADLYTEESLLTAKNIFISENQSKIIKTLRALSMAQDYYEKNPKESAKLVDKWLEGYDSQSVYDSMSKLQLSLGLSNTLLIHLERISSFFQLSDNNESKPVHLRDSIFSDYLRIVNPEIVTIY